MKYCKKMLALLIAALFICLSSIATFASGSAEGETGAGDNASEGSETGWNELDMSGHDITVSLPSNYYFCYDKNIKDYDDYFESIGWDYDDTVDNFEKQGIEIFAFNQEMTYEFYYIVEDNYDIVGTENLTTSSEDAKNSLYDVYYGTYFGTYSMYDLYDIDTVDLNGTTYIASTFLDYNDSSNAVPVAEYWTALNGKTYHFMVYGTGNGANVDDCMAELENIMDKVEFTKVLTGEEVKAEQKSANWKEAWKWIITIVSTLAVIAVIVVVIVIIEKRKSRKKAVR